MFSTGIGRLVLGFGSGGLCAGVMGNGLGGRGTQVTCLIVVNW